MKKVILISFIVLLGTFFSQAQAVLGKWKTIDDKTNKPKSIIEVYKKGNVYYGKVVEILTDNKLKKCNGCPGDMNGKLVNGLTIIYGLTKDGDEYNDGYIVDPNNGKEYRCKIELNGINKLDVRGYIGISLLGRTQTWHRVK